MKHWFNNFWKIIKKSAIEWNDSEVSRDAASISYYAIFSIPGLLIIVIWIAGIFFGQEAVQGEVSKSLNSFLGPKITKSIEDILTNVTISGANVFSKAVGIGSLVYGSTTMFFQLQKSFNDIWKVKPSKKSSWKDLIISRLNSLGLIVIIGFLLLITMVVSTLVTVLNQMVDKYINLEIPLWLEGVNFLVNFGFIIILFAMIFKILPGVKISWRSVWVGAAITGILFNIGRILLTYYFKFSDPGSAFGTAGAVILLMVWINYACWIVFFGAIFCKNYAEFYDHDISTRKDFVWQ